MGRGGLKKTVFYVSFVVDCVLSCKVLVDLHMIQASLEKRQGSGCMNNDRGVKDYVGVLYCGTGGMVPS